MCKRKGVMCAQSALYQTIHAPAHSPSRSRPPGAPAAHRRSTHCAQRQPRGARRQRDPRIPTLHQTLGPAPGPAPEGPPADAGARKGHRWRGSAGLAVQQGTQARYVGRERVRARLQRVQRARHPGRRRGRLCARRSHQLLEVQCCEY